MSQPNKINAMKRAVRADRDAKIQELQDNDASNGANMDNIERRIAQLRQPSDLENPVAFSAMERAKQLLLSNDWAAAPGLNNGYLYLSIPERLPDEVYNAINQIAAAEYLALEGKLPSLLPLSAGFNKDETNLCMPPQIVEKYSDIRLALTSSGRSDFGGNNKE